MTYSIELEGLPGPAQKILSGTAPRPACLMAAKGIIPGAKPGDIATVLAGLFFSEDKALADTAGQTLRQLPAPILNGCLQADLQEAVIHALALTLGDRAEVVEKLLPLRRMGPATLSHLAERATEQIGELIATNEQKLLKYPEAIERLYLNKRVRMSTSDRLLELAVRNGVELGLPAFKEMAAAIQSELVPEPTDEPTYDDVVFHKTEQASQQAQAALGDEDAYDQDEEGEEVVKEKAKPVLQLLMEASVTTKIRRAMLGTSSERLILIRDKNRLVATAAAKSPLMNESDAARITASKQVGDDVLRIIANNRELTRSYTVKRNLVLNPRTPFTFSSGLVPHLRDADLRIIAKSKNVPNQIQVACRRQLARKQGK